MITDGELVTIRDEGAFAAGLVEFAHSYGARARADQHVFVDLFRNGRIPGSDRPGPSATGRRSRFPA